MAVSAYQLRDENDSIPDMALRIVPPGVPVHAQRTVCRTLHSAAPVRALGYRILVGVTALSLSGLFVAAPASAQSAPKLADSPATAGELLGRLAGALRSLSSSAGDQFAGGDASALAIVTRVADDVADRFIATPEVTIATARERDRHRVDRGLAALALVEDLDARINSCDCESTTALLEAFETNVARIFNDGRASIDGATIVRAHAVDGAVLRAGTALGIVLEGFDLRSDGCGEAEAHVVGGGRPRVEADVERIENGAVMVHVPAIAGPGVYELSLRLRRRRLFLFCGSTTARVSFVARRPATYRVRYTVSATISSLQHLAWNAGELKETNETCMDRMAVGTFRLPAGWAYESHEWIVFVEDGAVKESEVVTDSAVEVRYRIAGRSGALCRGPTPIIHGRMEITGSRITTEPGPQVVASVEGAISRGETVRVPVRIEPAAESSIVGWSVDVVLTRPDGSEQTIPGRSGAGPLESEAQGGSRFEWDPDTRRLTITAPAETCVLKVHDHTAGGT
jgi:hypothetical protein